MSDLQVAMRARHRARGPVAVVVVPLFGICGAVALWWLSIIVFDIEAFLVPTPPDVASAAWTWRGYLLEQGWVTLQETLIGFGLAVAIGIPLGVVLTVNRIVGLALYPLVLTFNAIPKLALAPLLVAWMGFGASPKITMVVLVCFFPIVISTAAGMMSTPAELEELARSLTANPVQTFAKLRLRFALPQVFVGLKLAISLAIIGALIGEFSGGDLGLGFVITSAGGRGDVAQAFAAIGLLCVMSVGLFYLIAAIERLLLPWVRDTTAPR